MSKISKSKILKVLIIKSGIKKEFCAGANIKELKSQNLKKKQFFDSLQILRNSFKSFKKIIICIVNNLALGGGFEIALLSDLIFCNKNCKFGFPEIKLGLFPSIGGTLISKNLGRYKTNELIFTGKIIKGEELKRFGIVNEVFDDHFLEEKVFFVAENICRFGIVSLMKAKDVIGFSFFESGSLAMKNEADAFNGIIGMEEAREGVYAFLDKRKPEFDRF